MSSSLFSERKQDEKIIGFSPRPSPWSIESRSFGEVSCGMGLFGGSVGLLLGSIILFFFACLLEAASDEAAALLSFKRSSIETDPKGSLHSWGTGSPCSWSGIICTGAGERVSGLNLSYLGLVGRLRLDDLFAIHGLKEINLRGNSLNGNLSHAMAASCAFESVDLSGNNFTGRVAGSFLGHCNRLVFLNISGNSISDGVFPLSPSLQTLDMSRNNFSGDFSGFQFETCGNLTALDLSHNGIFGGVPARLGNCSRLNRLTLSHNRFSNGLFSFLGSMPSLTHLSISSNQLSGEIPPELAGICPTLIELYLSGNNLSGRLPAGFSSCTALEVLDIGRNQLSGDFIGPILGALPNLRILRLPFNNISGVLPILSMKRSIQLAEIDLSSNEFSGEIPAGLCLAFPSLRKLMLPNNFLSGRLPADLGNCTNLTALDLSFNGLSGPVPAEIWSLPELVDLAIWANKISGHISGELCSKGAALETLILNHNDIYGTIPPSIANCRRLVWLSLSGNRLAGNIPPAIGNLPSLAILQLGNNSLTGEIPSSIGRSRNLVWVDLSLNNITGAIPSSLASSSGLVFPGAVTGKDFAFLRNEGEGSSCAGAGVIFEFAGIRPERLASFPLVHACSATRIYTGTAVYTFTGNGTMIYLDLSFNSLAGFIPENIGAMNYLQVLNLGHNQLSGRIPDSFGGLKAIGVLDLSHNRLVGAIPPALGSLSFLVDLDVSNNNFSGEIPPAGQLMTFSPSRFANNSGLCGVPLPPCAPRQSSGDRLSYPSARDRRRGFSAGMLIGVAISIFSLFLLALALSLRRLRKKKAAPGKSENTQNRHLSPSGSSSWKLSGIMEPLSINIATFEKPLRKLTFAQLLEATNGFSQGTLIGSGGFGEVYRARLDDGGIVAVKKLVHVTDQGDREFVAEMETLGKIKHRNLVPLLGYCKVGEERLLVYDYMKHGSLETILHERRGKLDWQARKKIAVGSARGLAFLHHSCIPHIIHRDMKSSNVLLDDNLEARVSDFGMARLVSALDTHLSVSTLAGTPGYVPPEYYQSFRCTTKGDVYSYGVLLLELLTGRRPTGQNEFGENNNLVGWAKQMIEERRSGEIFDPELRRDAAAAAELEQYLKIACRCLDERPMRRPTMIQVMAMYKDQQVDSDSDMLDGFSLGSSAVSDSAENLSAP